MGFHISKIKIGGNLKTDLEALTLIRKAVVSEVSEVRLQVDTNQGYTLETAKKAIDTFVQLKVQAIEQPLPYWDFEGTAQLRKWANGKIKIMLDEFIHSVRDKYSYTKYAL